MKYLIQFFALETYLHLIYYFALIKIINFPNYIIYIALMIFMLIYYLMSSKKFFLNKNLSYWMLFYFVIYTIYYIIQGAGSDIKVYYVYALVNVFTFIAFSLLYNLDSNDMIITRKSIVVALLFGVTMVLYDFIHPGFFVLIKDYYSGRALATYQNQNLVGAIFIAGLILVIDIIPRKYRMFFIAYLFTGILVTFSRSNIILFIVIIIVMSIQKKLSKISTSILLFSLVAMMTWLYYIGFDYLSKEFDIKATVEAMDRLAYFISPDDVTSTHNDERKIVLNIALSMFADSPIIGNGIGSTRLWEYRVGPHNTFAMMWAELGLFGFLLVPTFLLATTYDIIMRTHQKEYKDMGILFIIFFTISSLFSHNMFEGVYIIFTATIISLLGSKNKI